MDVDRDDSEKARSEEMDDADVETALLTLLATQDIGPATEQIRLDRLSPIEKRVVLRMMRARIGYVDNRPESSTATDHAGSSAS